MILPELNIMDITRASQDQSFHALVSRKAQAGTLSLFTECDPGNVAPGRRAHCGVADLAISKLLGRLAADAKPQPNDEVAELGVLIQGCIVHSLHVENLAPQWQDGLETAVTGLLCTAAYRSNVLLSALDAEHKLHVRLRGNPGHMPLGILVNSVSGQPHIGVGPAIRRTAELLHSSRSQGKGRPQLPRPSSLNLKGGKGGGGGGFWQ